MGAGKTKIGRRLAARLNLPFSDSDNEIETAAGETIEEIFRKRGEAVFRDGERRVIARLLEQPPHILATGGGAFMDPATRALIAFLPHDAAANSLHAGIDSRLLLFAFLVSVAAGVLSGVAPALQSGRRSLISSLRERGGSASGVRLRPHRAMA